MYAKLFTSLYQGTLRGNSHGILVFTNLLAHCDRHGVVDMHPRAIADEVGLTVDEVRAALDMLEAPDPESRSAEEDGRRIMRLDEHRDWGWRVVNYAKYSAIRNADDRREQNRLAQARWREAHDNKHSKPNKPQSAHIDVDVDKTLAPPPVDKSPPVDKTGDTTGTALTAPPLGGDKSPSRQNRRADYIAANAKRLNLKAKPGESMQAFAERVQREATR